jgi:membrane-associated phospholipid phosphatase
MTKFLKSIAVLLYVLVMIIIELFYRNPLFNKSLELIPNLQSNQSVKGFWKFITIFGTEKVLIPFFLIFFNWYSLSKSFLYLTILIFSVYFDNVLKIIYNNPRPYWVSTAISSENCEGGYGNPSGHAFSSSCVYLTIWHLTSDNEFFTKRYWLRVIYLGITLIFIFLIMFSRLYLGVHSLNQLLFGFLLGLSLYVLIFLALEFHKLDTKSFIELISSYKI